MNRLLTNMLLVNNWLALGGTAYDGTTYGPPKSAIPWGSAGCPLVPRIYRIRYGQHAAPPLLSRALKSPHLTLADMDSEVLRRFNLVELSPQLCQDVRDFIYRLRVLPREVAIPVGLPLSWLTALPISSRLRNSLRRLPWPKERICEKPVFCSEFLTFPGVGKNSLNELLCVLESAELGQAENKVSPTVAEMTARILGHAELGQAESKVSPVKHVVNAVTTNTAFQTDVNEAAREAIRAGFLHFETHCGFPIVREPAREVVCSVSALGNFMREFVTWALAETDAQTIGDAISQVISGTRTVEVWQTIAELRLQHASNQPRHPYAILEFWALHLPERERHIFKARIACLEVSHTLQELADYFGVTRERVRQLENRVRHKLTEFTKGIEARPIRWRAETIRQRIGVAAPLAHVEHLLSPLDGQVDYRSILLRLAGPYDLVNGWVVLRSAVNTDPTTKIRDMADEVGYIDPHLATRELNKWGLDSSFHEDWLIRDARIRKLNGRLVRWGGPIGDKLIIALADIGRPATIDTLLDHIQEDRARTSANNALSGDARAVRVNQAEWALTSWGLSEYSGIAISIRKLLERERQPIPLEGIVTRLRRDLGLNDNSIRAYCQAPMFIFEDGAIYLRGDAEPYVYDNASLHSARGVFALGPHRVSLLFEVDGGLLRGSGRALTQAAGAILDVAVNQQLIFNNRDGGSVTITFPETSIRGPSIGSVRSLAESADAKLGDQLTLVLDRSDMSATAISTDVTQHEPGWPLVSRLTGIDVHAGMEGLAAALHCEKGEVRALLSKRGDEVVKAALPLRPISSELDRALARLEAQIQQAQEQLP